MKKILFCTIGLARGGTERTLINALDAIDYSKCDVTLYLRKDWTVFLPLVNPNVKVIINDCPKDYSSTAVAKVGRLVERFSTWISWTKGKQRAERFLEKYMAQKNREYEAEAYFFSHDEYDIAIAYDMAKECALFVKNHIKAKTKYTFFHSSKLDMGKAEIYEQFDGIIPVNEVIAKGIRREYPHLKEKVVAIENFIDRQMIVDEAQAKVMSRPANELVLCTCARYDYGKGYDIAINAAKILNEKMVDFKWFFIGYGDDQGKIIHEIVDEGLEDKIVVTGYQDNPYAYMQISDFYVHPAREEAHATTILENIILCKPIISTKTYAADYIFGRFPCALVTEFSGIDLANAILELYYNKEKQDELIDVEKSIDWNAEKVRYKKDIQKLLDGKLFE